MNDRVNKLIAQLTDPETVGKAAIAQELGDIADPAAINALVSALLNDQLGVRQAAVIALGEIGKTHLIPYAAIITLLADGEDAVRKTAASTLTAQGERVVIPLIDALQHDNSTVRGAVADLLGDTHDVRAYEPLLETCKTDQSHWVRSRAEKAINLLPVTEEQKQQAAPLLRPPPDLLQHRRSRTKDIQWPSLHGEETNQMLANARGQAKNNDDFDPDNMTAGDIQDKLDTLDLRLANGEITEATYQQLYKRWQSRLP